MEKFTLGATQLKKKKAILEMKKSSKSPSKLATLTNTTDNNSNQSVINYSKEKKTIKNVFRRPSMRKVAVRKVLLKNTLQLLDLAPPH